MARKKKVNKKVLTVIFLVGMTILVGGVLVVMHRYFQDPEPYLDEGLALMESGRVVDAANKEEIAGIEDPQERYERLVELEEQKETGALVVWKEARNKLQNAVKFSRNSNDRVKRKALEAMKEVFERLDAYDGIAKIYEELIRLDRSDYSNYKAKAEIAYQRAKDVGRNTSLWSEVLQQSEELIAQGDKESYGYILKAHAEMAMALLGASADPAASMVRAREAIGKVLELDGSSVAGQRLYAEWILAGADDKSEPDRLAALSEAEMILRQCLAVNENDPQAYLNLYEVVLMRKANLAASKSTGSNNTEAAREELRAVKQEVLGELDQIISKFPEDGRFFKAAAQIERLGVRQISDLAPAMASYREAIARDKENAELYLNLANLHQVRAESSADDSDDLVTAFSLLREGLYLKSMNSQSGPEQFSRRNIRFMILDKTIEVSTVLCRETEGVESDKYKTVAISCRDEMVDRLGKDLAITLKAEGLVAWSEGDVDEAIRDLYLADKKQADEGRADGRVKVMLSELLGESGHTSLAVDYAGSAIQEYGVRTPKVFLMYMREALKFPGRNNMENLIRLINEYEEAFANQGQAGSLNEILKVKAQAQLKLGDFKAASETVSRLEGDDSEARKLRGMSIEDIEKRMASLAELAKEVPGDGSVVVSLYSYYMGKAGGDSAYYDKAREVVGAAVEAVPENVSYRQMLLVLNEPDPNSISPERAGEIQIAAWQQIPDVYQRSMGLAKYLHNRAQGKRDSDAEGMKADLEEGLKYYDAALAERKNDIDALNGKFNVMIIQEKWDRARDVMAKVRGLDEVEGMRLESYLAAAQEKWTDAAAGFERYLDRRPIDARAHASLARVYEQMDERAKAISSAESAARLDRFNVDSNFLLVSLIHQDNVRRYGENLEALSLEDLQRILRPLDAIGVINPGHIGALHLRRVYYPYYMKALSRLLKAQRFSDAQREAIEKQIAMAYQSVLNTCKVFIANEPENARNWLYMVEAMRRYAEIQDTRSAEDKVYAEIDKVFKQAIALYPDSSDLATSYAIYLRDRGEVGLAREALEATLDKSEGENRVTAAVKLAAFHLEEGNLDSAEKVLRITLESMPDSTQLKMALAELMLRRGKAEEAVALAEEIRAVEESGRVLAFEIDILRQIGQMDRARELLTTLREKYADMPQAKLLSAQIALQDGNYAEARGYADELLVDGSGPGAEQAYQLKAEALYFEGKLDDALACLDSLREKAGPDSTVGRLQRSRVLWRLRRYDDAIAELRSALVGDPNYDAARQQLMGFLRDQRRWAELANLYDDSLEKHPDSIDLYLGAGETAVARAREYAANEDTRRAAQYYEQALSQLQRAWKLSQEQGQLQTRSLASLGEVMLQLRQYDELVKMIDENLQGTREDVPLLLHKAEAYFRKGEKTAALQEFESALTLAADDANLSEVVLREVSRVGEVPDILVWTRKKLAERSDWVSLYLLAAYLEQVQGNSDEALNLMLTGKSLAENKEKDDDLIRVYSQLSNLYERIGRPDDSLEVYRQWQKIRPEDPAVLNNLAYRLLQGEANVDEAVDFAQKAYKLVPQDINVMDTYALALLKQGKFVQAERIAQEVIREAERRNMVVLPEFEYRLAEALAGQGNKARARELMEGVLNRLKDSQSQSDAVLRKDVEASLAELD